MAAFWDPGGHFPLISEPFGLDFGVFFNTSGNNFRIFWVGGPTLLVTFFADFCLEATCFEEAYGLNFTVLLDTFALKFLLQSKQPDIVAQGPGES